MKVKMERVQMPEELDFHDDILENITFDLSTLEITLTIQKLAWVPVKQLDNPLSKMIIGKTPYKAIKSKRVKLILKARKGATINIEAMHQTEILWCYIEKQRFVMALVMGDIACDIDNYKIEESNS